MRDGAKRVSARGEREKNAALAQAGDRLVGPEPEAPDVDEHEVRLHLLEIDREPRFREPLAEPAGVRVVIRKPLDVMIERVEARGGNDARLAHRAPEEVLHAPRLRHPLARAGHERAQRAPEALGEAERDGVELAPVLGCRHSARHGRVHQPRAVEMDGEIVSAGLGDDRAHLFERPDATAAAVVRVLEAHHRGRRRMQVAAGADGVAHLLRREAPGLRMDGLHGEAGVHGRPAQLVEEDVRHGLGQHLVPGLVERIAQGDLVGHRRGRHEHRLFLPEQIGSALLEREHGGVFPLLLVADDGLGDGPAHGRARLGQGVGAEVDHGPQATVCPTMDLGAPPGASFATAGSRPTAPARSGSGLRAARGGYAEMTSLPAALRAELDAEAPFSTLPLEQQAEARDGTVKALFSTADGHPVETVLMRYRDGRRSLCLSAQSGCPLTCTFCATGAMRFGRNLTDWEILDQALHFRRAEPMNHAVFMGMGEPMLNLDNVVAAARRLPDLGITHRRTTVSTVGWLPGLRRFIDEVDEPIRLALSLHAADDALRSRLMPVNERYPLADILGECRRYVELRRRKVFVEYVMLAGVNDRVEQAEALAQLLDRRLFKVNLIPYNPTGSLRGLVAEGDLRLQGGARPCPAARDRPPHARPRHRGRLRPAGGRGVTRLLAGEPGRDVVAAGFAREVGRRAAVVRSDARIGALPEQEVHEVSVSELRGGVERSKAAPLADVGVGPVLEQKRRCLPLAGSDRALERRHASSSFEATASTGAPSCTSIRAVSGLRKNEARCSGVKPSSARAETSEGSASS